ncbi:cytochrome c biogenesis protein DipZ, partial [Candidatus Collierbacteria bacterium]|nr:cytochrome c biogenesis protein DipZ [Candidatus Collierbacteria bacterium]
MEILLIFAFISGLLTILAPCIWPLLPLILSTTATGGRKKPLGVVLGIVLSFAIFTLSISYLVRAIGFDPNSLRTLAVVVITLMGFALVFPAIGARAEVIVGRIGSFVKLPQRERDGLSTGFITGLALGVVWSPCAGPILATIATLAATRMVSTETVAMALTYSGGVGIPLFFFATFGRNFLTKGRFLSAYTGRIQQFLGIVMIVTAVAIWTNYDKVIQAKLLDVFPAYSQFLYKLEGSKTIRRELGRLRGEEVKEEMPTALTKSLLPILKKAPEFGGISNWINSEPLTMEKLRGKVVLIDFWTYTCINCIRTLPHVTNWYEKYKDQGLVVIGVHTPEFEFEKNTQNVIDAMRLYKINYPVAQDNDYVTWNNFDNLYWPSKYLIDKDGNIRYYHFGEGKYAETEMAIQQLLAEIGMPMGPLAEVPDITPSFRLTPEIYLGLSRMEFLASREPAMIGKQTFTLPMKLPPDRFAFGGTWIVGRENSESTLNSVLELNFVANKVFLVITPKTKQDIIKVFLDGKEIGAGSAGADVMNGVLQVDSPRLYELINLPGKPESHI